jgi:signal transduction histidine kinase
VNWYRSLYWRIAAGFIACLAVLLIVQGMLFVWMMATAGSAVPNQPPDRFAATIALDLTHALERDSALDVEQYVRQEYADDNQPFLVLLADGRTIEVGDRFSESLKTEERARLEMFRTIDPARLIRGGALGRGAFRPPGRPGWPDGNRSLDRRDAMPRMPGPDGMPPATGSDAMPRERPEMSPGEPRGQFDPGRGGDARMFPQGRAPGFRGGRPALIVADDRLFGMVVVPPQPPFMFLLRRYAPTLVTVAAVTLIVGGVLAAFVVFGPARRRLKDVEDAARRLGSGDLNARAPVSGNDEVTAVAAAFNAMAHDLAARTEALVEADRARRQLLADVSHELNTPVTAMRGYLETLSMPEFSVDAASRAKYLGIVVDETSRLERIIGDLLDLARLEGGGGELRLETIPVEELFARVVARHERFAETVQVTLETQVAPDARTVVADRTRFEQVLQNLAANALRYAPAGSTVMLQAIQSGGSVSIRVSDAGPGIPPEHLARVFDRFYKVDSSRAAQFGHEGGSGLGLSIVKAIVERHGARISVASEPGRTVFTIDGLTTRHPS